MIPSIKTIVSSLYTNIRDPLVQTFRTAGDPLCSGRRRILGSTFLSGLLTNLTTGTYFTGLMLAMGAGEQYISYVTIAITLCGFIQFLSPLLLERMPRRKSFLLGMRTLYYAADIVLLGLIPVLPAITQEVRLALFMAAILLRNTANAVSISGISVWQIQSIPPDVQNHFFTVSNFGSTIIGIVTAYCASALVDTCEAQSIGVFGFEPTITAILILRGIALFLAIPEMGLLLGLPEYPYTGSEEKQGTGLRMLGEPLTHRRFMMTISIYIFWIFINAVIGEFFNVYLIDIVDMSYTYISLGAVISLPILFLMTPVWSAVIARIRWYRALPAAFFGYAFAYFFNVLITETTHFYYFVVMICCYLCLPCINVVFAYLPYINMPQTHRTAYISMMALGTALAQLLGNFFGDRFMHITHGYTLPFFGMTLTNYQYLNLVQMALLFGLAGYVALVGKRLGENPPQ